MKRIYWCAFTAFLFILSSASGQSKENIPGLNGRIFKIHLTKTDGKRSGWQWTKDELTFKSGQLKTKEMSANEGFLAAAYKITGNDPDKIIFFEATAKNKGSSNIKWNGEINGEKIKGTAVWTNGQGVQSYSFLGTLKKK